MTGKPRPKLSWSRVSTTGEELTLPTSGQEVEIVQVSRLQGGEYSCTADNGVGAPVQARISLVVECECCSAAGRQAGLIMS